MYTILTVELLHILFLIQQTSLWWFKKDVVSNQEHRSTLITTPTIYNYELLFTKKVPVSLSMINCFEIKRETLKREM